MLSQGAAFARNDVFQAVVKLSLVSVATYFTIKWLMNQVDPTTKTKSRAKDKARERLQRLGINRKHKIQLDNLTDYEMMIASHLIVPEEISITWSDIAGLDDIIQELKETVILPIQRQELFADSLLTQPPKGVLLHGPPGVGKTLIAKATAKEAQTHFINLDVSILTDKWYGESQKLAAAVFSLAVKLQPCIIFIDEIDSFLRSRNQHDHEATAMMKAQFMSLWDGLITDSNCMVIVMGATNRPQDLDKAIQRRMPATFHINLPNLVQRERILELILLNEPVEMNMNLHQVAAVTEGYSGSDLRELCRLASVFRVRDYMRANSALNASTSKVLDTTDSSNEEEQFHDAIRPITMEDLRVSLKKMNDSRTSIRFPNHNSLEIE
ncbi:outer mitochondrial transmembrane helix translocase-like isoform X2 [Arctopsyche grandis]|uniref:outer mitochondrial transmembrane helix translocase-like isoform X2 n=1 Tax=Arctopsyche grandis TaxID=121162 RepID=UPI00406D7C30